MAADRSANKSQTQEQDRSAWFQQVEELPRHEAFDWLRDAAPPEARQDPELLLAAVAKTGAGALRLASRALRQDRDFVLAACSLNGFALGAAAPELQADRDFVLAVVAADGDALDEVAPALKADREVVIAAVTQKGSAVRFAAEEFQRDSEVLSLASQDPEITKRVSSGRLLQVWEVEEEYEVDVCNE